MYDGFYGFRDRPFSLLPDPEFLYLSPQHEKALGLLELSLHNQAGFCVISGEIGAGKTTLIRKLLTMMGGEFRVGLVTNTLDSFGDLLNRVLLAYELPTQGGKVERHERFIDFAIAQYGRGRRTVLIVDEAQNLTVDALEELRMLSNVNADKHQVLQIILVGQPGLRDTLKRPELTQFAQRILMDFHLAPLGREDTARYIRHRLLVAGADPELFTPEAAVAVYRYSGGIPRIINLLCDTALVYGYAEGSSRIPEELVHTVVRERQNTGAAPALRLAAMAPLEANPVEQVRVMAVVPDTTEPVSAPEPADAPSVDAFPAVESCGIGEEESSPAPEAAEVVSAQPVQVQAGEPKAEPAAGVALEDAAISEPPAEPDTSAMRDELSAGSAEPAPTTAAAPQSGLDLQSDAEWLRHLADSAIPAGARERFAEESAEITAVQPEPSQASVPMPAASAHRRHPGLGVGAGLVALVLAGGSAAYWFAGRDSGTAPPGLVAVESPAAVMAPPPQPAPEDQASRMPPEPKSAPSPLPVAEVPPPDRETAPITVSSRPAAQQHAVPRPVPATPEPAAPAPKQVTRAATPVRKQVEAPTPQPEPDRVGAAAVPPASKPERAVKSAVSAAARVKARPEPAAPMKKPESPPAPASAAAPGEIDPPAQQPAAPREPAPAPHPVASGTPVTPPTAAVQEPVAPASTSEDYRFSADPCKGPAARYLSTCR